MVLVWMIVFLVIFAEKIIHMKFEVFISYSRHDIDAVRLIKSNIEELTGVRCWMDLKAIESGSKRFTKDIVDGINNCEVFLFMLSEYSQRAEFALRELEFANEKKKHVVIVNINNCQLNDEFQFMYGLSDRINWKDELQREKLLQDLKKWGEERERIEAEKRVKDEVERERLEKERLEKEKKEEQVRLKTEQQCQERELVKTHLRTERLSFITENLRIILKVLATIVLGVFVISWLVQMIRGDIEVKWHTIVVCVILPVTIAGKIWEDELF